VCGTDDGAELGQADKVSCRSPNSEALNMTMSMESVIKVIILSWAICRLTRLKSMHCRFKSKHYRFKSALCRFKSKYHRLKSMHHRLKSETKINECCSSRQYLKAVQLLIS
jgi:hypothetical protein